MTDDLEASHSRLFNFLSKDIAASDSNMSEQAVLMHDIHWCPVLTR